LTDEHDGSAPTAELRHVGGLPRASDIIAQQLRRLIVSGAIVRGDTLQPTTELMERFGVSRPTLREAFRVLENEKLIAVRRGSRSGVKVLQPSTEAAARVAGETLQAIGTTLGDLYQATLGFEPFAARLLAERADPRDIVRLRAHATLLEKTMTDGSPGEHGVQLARFHKLVVQLTGNEVMKLVAELISTAIERHQQNSGGGHEGGGDAERERHGSVGTRSIRKLIRLIEAGDGEGAEAHWRAHLINSNRFWLQNQDAFQQINVVD
jgi:DNA-binding FadR family transcriptional regulator